ncbi:MAG: hypothetical protein RIB60_06125 [Phycisphaerales bacterium]
MPGVVANRVPGGTRKGIYRASDRIGQLLSEFRESQREDARLAIAREQLEIGKESLDLRREGQQADIQQGDRSLDLRERELGFREGVFEARAEEADAAAAADAAAQQATNERALITHRVLQQRLMDAGFAPDDAAEMALLGPAEADRIVKRRVAFDAAKAKAEQTARELGTMIQPVGPAAPPGVDPELARELMEGLQSATSPEEVEVFASLADQAMEEVHLQRDDMATRTNRIARVQQELTAADADYNDDPDTRAASMKVKRLLDRYQANAGEHKLEQDDWAALTQARKELDEANDRSKRGLMGPKAVESFVETASRKVGESIAYGDLDPEQGRAVIGTIRELAPLLMGIDPSASRSEGDVGSLPRAKQAEGGVFSGGMTDEQAERVLTDQRERILQVAESSPEKMDAIAVAIEESKSERELRRRVNEILGD